jgi:hypothetical protein
MNIWANFVTNAFNKPGKRVEIDAIIYLNIQDLWATTGEHYIPEPSFRTLCWDQNCNYIILSRQEDN